jgi:pyruvate dehydrogenase E2 component (dihydrolipoamide acetyltransferase)
MSKYEFKLPDIGEGVTEGEIVKWLVTPGETVREDQPMVEVMTDKATVTITSPKAGKIVETRGAAGAVVPVHSVLVVFDLGGGAAASAPAHTPSPGAQAAKKTDGPAATAVGDIKEDLPGMTVAMAASPRSQTQTASALPKPPATPSANGKSHASSTLSHAGASHAATASTYFNAKPLATPSTRKHARDLGIDLRTVAPSGPAGRVTKGDVSRDHDRSQGPTSGAPATEGVSPHARSITPRADQTPVLPRPTAIAPSAEDERVPLRGVRKRIFEGMSRSKHTAAHFTFVEECEVTNLKALRERLKPIAEKQGVKLTFLPFFVKAVVAALKRHPTLNSAFDETTQEIVVKKRIHIGVAAATEAGLIVPVVRDADRKSILDVAREIARLGEEAKAGKVRAEDLGGSTFTITSLGSQGGLFATPILNHPEVGILGIHQMKEKPVVKAGQIVVGNVMLLSLSFDHRIIDGHVGAAFAYDIIGFLEDPDRLFVEMA